RVGRRLGYLETHGHPFHRRDGHAQLKGPAQSRCQLRVPTTYARPRAATPRSRPVPARVRLAAMAYVIRQRRLTAAAPRAYQRRVPVEVIAHRGASGTCPENTLAAF